jgi:hypothetical protein
MLFMDLCFLLKSNSWQRESPFFSTENPAKIEVDGWMNHGTDLQSNVKPAEAHLSQVRSVMSTYMICVKAGISWEAKINTFFTVKKESGISWFDKKIKNVSSFILPS